MNKKTTFYLTIGFIFTLIAGFFSAYAYFYSMENPLVGMFCPINSSPWETIKLIFFPSLFYFIFGWLFFRKTHPDFFHACFSGLLSGSFLFLPLFYTYSGISGSYSLPLTVGSLMLSSYLIYYFTSFFLQSHCRLLSFPVLVCLLVWILVCFFSFTYQPPSLPLFTPILYNSV